VKTRAAKNRRLKDRRLKLRPALQAAIWAALVLSAIFAAQPAGAAPWTDQRSLGPIVCRADFSLAGQEALFREVADVQRELQRILGIAPARQPIEVFLFHDEAAYARYIQARFPQAPYRRALYVKSSGPGQVFVFRGKDLPVDLRHECTHAFLHASLPAVPLWLDEGLAEFFEVPADKRAFDNPHLSLPFKTEIQFGRVPRLSDLESRRDLAEMSAIDYRNAWAWVHLMLYGSPEAHEELTRYLAELAGGGEPGELGPRLTRRLPDLEQRFLRHFRSWRR